MASFTPSPASYPSGTSTKLIKHTGNTVPWAITSIVQDTIGPISPTSCSLSGVTYVSSTSKTQGNLNVGGGVDRTHDLTVRINVAGIDHDLRVEFV
jgi:hypothetical protein